MSRPHDRACAWLNELGLIPENAVFGFTPCDLILNADKAHPFTNPNVAPAFIGGDFTGCWHVTWTKYDKSEDGFWAQHGQNPEARRFFRWLDSYPSITLRNFRQSEIYQWLTECHEYEAAQQQQASALPGRGEGE